MSIPKRHSLSPFRRYSSYNADTKPALQIDTEHLDMMKTSSRSPSRVRQRLSFIFRSPSPVVTSLKDTFSAGNNASTPVLNSSSIKSTNSSKRMSTFSLFKSNEPILEDDKYSTASSSSDNLSENMPASPNPVDDQVDNSSWEMIGVPYSAYNEHQKENQKSQHHDISLAYHVNQILGSTLDEVDEEIDQDWEESRRRLRQSLQLNKKISI